MENELNYFQQKIQQGINPVGLIFVFLEIVFLAVVGTVFTNILGGSEVVSEIGADDVARSVDVVDGELSEDIGAAIYDTVALNTDGNQNVDKSGLAVRDGSLINKQFSDTGLRYVSFVVDIPELEQSYRVYYDDYDKVSEEDVSGRAPEILVACLSNDDEVIYKDFNCRDNFGDLIGYSIAGEYEDLMELKGTSSAGGYKVYLPGDKRVDGTIQEEAYVEILSYCVDGSEDDAVGAVSDYFGELGLKLADFNYGVVEECEYYNEDEQ